MANYREADEGAAMEEEATATGTERRVGAQEDCEGEEGSTTKAGSIEE